ncbi:MAG: O-antigen ligase family protein [Thermoguttaceae bacterium]
MLLTGSRMGFIVVCAMGAMVGFIYLLKRPVFTIGSTLLAGVIFLFLFPKIMPESTWERLTKTRDELQTGTWSGRIIIWEAGFALFQQYPVLGTGSGTALRVIGQALGASRPIAAHNTYLSMSVELGVVGLLLFMSILIVALIYTFKMPFRERYTWSIILISWTLCAFAGSLEDEKLLWLILGLIACQFATFTEKGVAKIRAEPLGTLGPGRQLLVRPRWGNTRGT